MNVVETLSVFPELIKIDSQAALIYATAKQFCDKRGFLTVELQKIADHLNLESGEMEQKCDFLKRKGLMTDRVGKILFLPFKELQSSKVKTSLEKFAYEQIPEGFEVLFDDKKMYECYIALGTRLWRVLAEIANYFKLDYPTFLRLMYSEKFKKEFSDVRSKVEHMTKIVGKKVSKRKNIKQPPKTIDELTKQLLEEVHIRNGVEIPRKEWKAAQLLRVYVLMYNKTYQENYRFTTNPFSSLEIREIKKIYEAFEGDVEQVIVFLKWCFKVKRKQKGVFNPIRIRFCSSDNVIREFLRVGSDSKNQEVKCNSLLPMDFIEWIKNNYPELQSIYNFSKLEDLVWLEQAYRGNELPDERLRPIIIEAIRRNFKGE